MYWKLHRTEFVKSLKLVWGFMNILINALIFYDLPVVFIPPKKKMKTLWWIFIPSYSIKPKTKFKSDVSYAETILYWQNIQKEWTLQGYLYPQKFKMACHKKLINLVCSIKHNITIFFIPIKTRRRWPKNMPQPSLFINCMVMFNMGNCDLFPS